MLKKLTAATKAKTGYGDDVYDEGSVVTERDVHEFLDAAKYFLWRDAEAWLLADPRLRLRHINDAPRGRWTALHQAAYGGSTEGADILLRYGADPTVRNRDGETPAVIARSHGHALLADRLERAAEKWERKRGTEAEAEGKEAGGRKDAAGDDAAGKADAEAAPRKASGRQVTEKIQMYERKRARAHTAVVCRAPWVPIYPMGTERAYCAAASDTEHIYAVGGENLYGEALDVAEVLNFRTRQWNNLPPMSSKRSRCGAAVIGGILYVVGGTNGSAKLNSMEAYDPRSKSWKALPPMKDKRSCCAAAALGGKLYAFGGWNGFSAMNSAEVYDPNDRTWTALPPMRKGRSWCGAATVRDRLFVIGGDDKSKVFGSVEVYSPATGKWTLVARPMGSTRTGCAAAAWGDKLYVFGGHNGSAFKNSTEVYDADAQTWSAFADMSPNRRAFSAACVQGQIVLVGGRSIERPQEFPPPQSVTVDPDRIEAEQIRIGAEQIRHDERGGEMEESRREEEEHVRQQKAEATDAIVSTQPLSDASEVMNTLMSSLDQPKPRPVPLSYLERCTDGFSDERKLGEGAFSCVYEGRDRAIRRKFAVKRMRVRFLVSDVDLEEARNTFEREIATLKHFRHPNIAKMYAYYVAPDRQFNHCLVFELASNGSLYDVLKNRDKLHWTTRINIALDISKALEYLHAGQSGQICFHRDVKSANVCLRRNYTALLIDCGVSKMIPDGDAGDMTMTIMESAAGNGVHGTPGYICPMYLRRMGRYSSSNDVFSLGVVMAEIFTGFLQNRFCNGEDMDMFNRYSADGIDKRDLDQDADMSAGDWDEAIRREFACVMVECLSLNPKTRPSIKDIVQRLGVLAARARPRSPGERNHITVLSSAPLVYTDTEGSLHPITESPNHAMERDLLATCIKESKRDIKLSFDVATDDRLQAAVTRRCGCLHFSGHGCPDCLLFEDGTGGAHWMGEKKLFDCVHEEPFKFVFVSACYSLLMGKALVKAGVRHVVCCKHDQELRDDAAMKFTRAFYYTLAEGYTVKVAFEKGKMAVDKRFEEEVEKFVLLPQDGGHDVHLFDADILEWIDEPSPEILTSQYFVGREIEMYNIIQLLLNHWLVSLVGEEGVGCRSLASAVGRYIDQRKSTVLCIDCVYIFQRKEHESDLSMLKQLHRQLEKEGLADCLSDEDHSVLIQRLTDAVSGMKALIVFCGVKEDDCTLLSFVANLPGGTGASKLLITSRAALDVASISLEKQVFELGPLSTKDAAILFGQVCPHANSYAKRMAVLDRITQQVYASDPSLFESIRKGIPAQIIRAAKSIAEEEYESLFE